MRCILSPFPVGALGIPGFMLKVGGWSRSLRRTGKTGHKISAYHLKADQLTSLMSALPPEADMCSATRYVRFVPIADIRVQHPLKDKSGGQRLCAAGRRHMPATVNREFESHLGATARWQLIFQQGQRLALSLRPHPFFGCSTSVKRFPCAAAEPARPPPAPRSTHAAPTARTAPTSGPATYTQ